MFDHLIRFIKLFPPLKSNEISDNHYLETKVKYMIGAIIGDIIGSRFEGANCRSKNFDLFTYKNRVTDDSVMSLAIAKAVLESNSDYSDLGEKAIKYMQEIGRHYPHCGYGRAFKQWIFSNNPVPYMSFGNGAAMRVSACGFVAKTLEEAIFLSNKVTEVTHNHPEGIKGAEATTVAIFLARTGRSIDEIRSYIDEHYYPMNFTLDEIRLSYQFSSSCQGSVPQALKAFLESTSFEDAIRNAVSIGGDSDTIAAITGSISEAYYGISEDLKEKALIYLNDHLIKILHDFDNKYPTA